MFLLRTEPTTGEGFKVSADVGESLEYRNMHAPLSLGLMWFRLLVLQETIATKYDAAFRPASFQRSECSPRRASCSLWSLPGSTLKEHWSIRDLVRRISFMGLGLPP